MHFPEKDKIFSRLSKILPTPTKIIVGVSGWPDSRLAFALLNDYYFSKWRDTQLLIVAHFHHGQRKESDKEQQQIFKWYKNYHIYYNTDIPKKWQKETALRNLRKEFFKEVCQKEDVMHIATWHNLDDRIETSFINIIQGTSLQGLHNMTFCDYREWLLYIRPLINRQKKLIQDLCAVNNIEYFIDPSNADTAFTLRNALRHDIFPKITTLTSRSKWYNSWSTIYRQLEYIIKDERNDRLTIRSLPLYPSWGADFCYSIRLFWSSVNKKYTENDRAFLFQKLGIYKRISHKTLEEWVRFSNKSEDGYKYLSWVYFLSLMVRYMLSIE